MFVTTYVLLWTFVIFQVMLSLGILAEIRRLRSVGVSGNVSPLPLDTLAPVVRGIDMWTGTQTHARAVHGDDHVVLFVSPTCPTCVDLVGSLLSGTERSVVMVCRGAREECQAMIDGEAAAGIRVFVDPENEIAQAYGANVTPMAVVVSGRRVRGYGRPSTDIELQDLCRRILGRSRCDERGTSQSPILAMR